MRDIDTCPNGGGWFSVHEVAPPSATARGRDSLSCPHCRYTFAQDWKDGSAAQRPSR